MSKENPEEKENREQGVVYTLCVADMQTVADEVLERKLAPSEIKKIADVLPEKVNWFEAIERAILDVV